MLSVSRLRTEGGERTTLPRRVLSKYSSTHIRILYPPRSPPILRQYLIDNCGCASLTDHNGKQPSTQILDYVFSHFTGIYLSSILYFILYAAVSKNKPMIYPKAILPAFISGLMWSVAQVKEGSKRRSVKERGKESSAVIALLVVVMLVMLYPGKIYSHRGAIPHISVSASNATMLSFTHNTPPPPPEKVSWFIANSALSFAVAFPLVTSGPGFVAAMWGLFLFKEITGKRNFVVLGVAFIVTVSSGICIAMSREGGAATGGNTTGNASAAAASSSVCATACPSGMGANATNLFL